MPNFIATAIKYVIFLHLARSDLSLGSKLLFFGDEMTGVLLLQFLDRFLVFGHIDKQQLNIRKRTAFAIRKIEDGIVYRRVPLDAQDGDGVSVASPAERDSVGRVDAIDLAIVSIVEIFCGSVLRSRLLLCCGRNDFPDQKGGF